MRAETLRAASLALATLLACCRSQPLPAPIAAVPHACSADPDGAPLTADRGIGGTGAPVLTADRGIGGTGIVGVITGFGSVCLAGQEVALPPDIVVAVDQLPAAAADLRAGQVAVVDAAGDPAGLRARRIVIRYEAVGRVDDAQGDRIRVAGQDIVLSPQTWGLRPGRGEWIAVSGLRRGDGVIEATRIERPSPGPVLVHGTLVKRDGGLLVGALPIRRDPATVALVGQLVTMTGMIGQNGEMLPFSIAPDLLIIDPVAYFGPRVGVVLVEGFAVVDGGRLRLAPGFSAPAPGFRLDGAQRGVFRFERSEGGVRATGFGDRRAGFAPPPQVDRGARFEPAPMPNRGVGRDRAEPQGGPGPNLRGQPGRDRSFGRAAPGSGGFGPPADGPSRQR